MMKKLLYILVFPIAFGFMGCEALDDLDKYPGADPGKTATLPISGEYFVTLDSYDTGTNAWVEDALGYGYVKIIFSNTAANDKDVVWFDDLLFWPTKAKIKCDPLNKSFTPGTYNSNFAQQIVAPEDTSAFRVKHKIEYKIINVDKNAVKDSFLVSGYGMTVKILTGTIELGTFVAASKAKTDAINIELEWSDDPGTKYRYKGYRRTGFLEDEH